MQIRKVPPEYKKKYVTYPLVPAKIVTTTTKKTKKTKCNIALLHSPIANLQIFKSWEQNSLEPTKSKIDRIAVGYQVSSPHIRAALFGMTVDHLLHFLGRPFEDRRGYTSSYVSGVGDCLVNRMMPFPLDFPRSAPRG